MHRITKAIEFSYGHRLINYSGKCKNLHGHNATVDIDLESATLDKRGMVLDFGEVKTKLKKWIDQHWDHRLILCAKDPWVKKLKSLDPTIMTIDENPTAENLAKILYLKAKELGLPVCEIRFWETKTSCASYRSIST